jgi:hypothetical protein
MYIGICVELFDASFTINNNKEEEEEEEEER